MTKTTAITDFYQSAFERMERKGFNGQPEAVRNMRLSAMERFVQLGFPTTRMEAWRNTSVESIAGLEFHIPVEPAAFDPRTVEPFHLQQSFRVVVADGRFLPALSPLDGLPPGVEVRGLTDALANVPERVLSHLGRYVDFNEQAFVALNTAFLSDGVFISVPPEVVVDRPVQLLYISTDATWLHPPQADYAGQAATISHPRTLVVAGEGSRLTVVEHYVGLPAVQTGLPGGPTFTNAVTEIAAGAGSIVDYVRVQQESDNTTHIATLQTHQEADSRVGLHTITVGGKLVRNDVNIILAGEGAEVALNGLYLVRGRRHVDNHTRIDHAAPHCTSRENYKGILDDQGHGIFNGRIVVRPKAQKTNATQSNQNLMLSDKALVNTEPQLEIYADDVKCTHGSTVGQIDEETMFYFLSRGIDRGAARRLLIHGFTQEVISLVENDDVRKYVDELVSRWLPDGHVPIKAITEGRRIPADG
jgi:Fe-S cluster assembly protein SufD